MKDGTRAKRIGILGAILCFAMMCLTVTGCGERKNGSGAETEQKELVSYDYRTRMAAQTGPATEGESFKMAAYYPYDFPRDDAVTEQWMQMGIERDRLLMKVNRVYESAEPKMFLFRLDGGTGEKEFQEVTQAKLKEQLDEGFLLAVHEDTLFLFQNEFEEDPSDGRFSLKSSRVVRVNSEGEELGRTELTAGYREMGWGEKNQYCMYPSDPVIDPAGYYYVMNLSCNRLCQVCGEDQIRIVADYSRMNGAYIVAGTAWDNTPLFALQDSESGNAVFFWVDGESGERKEFGQIPIRRNAILQFYLCSDGVCYYIALDNCIYRWDLAAGKQEKIFDLRENDIGKESQVRMTATEDGEVRLYAKAGEELAMIGLDATGLRTEHVVTIWEPDDANLKKAAAGFARKHPEVTFEFLETSRNWEDRETEFLRLTNQALNGEMPDLLCLSRREMELLWEKKLLADLDSYVAKDIRKDLLPNVWESGAKQDGQAGLCLQFNLLTLIAGKDVCEEKNWDIMDLVELLEQDRTEYLFAVLGEQNMVDELHYQLNNLEMLVCTSGFRNMPFLDLKSGRASFDGEEFARLLKQLKRYRNKACGYRTSDCLKAVADGDCLSMWSYMDSLMMYSEYMAAGGESCCMAGYPDGEGGVYFQPFRFLAVGAGSGNEEIIREFLTYYLEGEGGDLRESTLRAHLHRDDSGRWLYDEGGTSAVLKSKPDGSNYLDEYLEFMKRCVPQPNPQQEINLIVEEEADKYFQDGQDLESTCRVIQNRVQLYLNE